MISSKNVFVVLIYSISLVCGFIMPLRDGNKLSTQIGTTEGGSISGSLAVSDVVRNAKDGILRLTSSGRKSKYDVDMKHLLELQGYIATLEESTLEVKDMQGGQCWELIYANDDPTRSSPFFSAFRKTMRDVKTPFDPLSAFPKNFADAIFSVTDNIPIKSVGRVRQYIDQEGKRMKSEVKVIVNPVGSSLMCTTSEFSLATDTGALIGGNVPSRKVFNVRVTKTEVIDSTVAKYLPFLDPTSNTNGLPSGAVLELLKPGSSTFQHQVSFNDGDLRISRSLEDIDSIFIYKRVDAEQTQA